MIYGYKSVVYILILSMSVYCGEKGIIDIMRGKQAQIKKPITRVIGFLCGERGIRTPGPVTVNSFQDCRNRPLCHFSLKIFLFLVAQI